MTQIPLFGNEKKQNAYYNIPDIVCNICLIFYHLKDQFDSDNIGTQHLKIIHEDQCGHLHLANTLLIKADLESSTMLNTSFKHKSRLCITNYDYEMTYFIVSILVVMQRFCPAIQRTVSRLSTTERLCAYIAILITSFACISILLLTSVSEIHSELSHAIAGKVHQRDIIKEFRKTSFHNEWFRKHFILFDAEAHTHHKSLPSYYPIKTQKLFTKYVILNDDKYKCKLSINTEQVSPTQTFQHFKIGETSSNYWIDYDSFYCDTLLTLNGNLLWKVNFFIIENSTVTENKTIREFEIRINAKDPLNKAEILRTAGKVRDPSYDHINTQWKYPSDFYIHEPNLYHDIYPIHTYDNRYFEFTQSISPDLGRTYPLHLFENNTDHSIINKYYKTTFKNQLNGLRKMGISFNIDDYLHDFKEMKYYGSTLQNTPFQVMIEFEDHKHNSNLPKVYCYDAAFHFDSYQSETPKEISVNINSDTVTLSQNVDVYVLPKRIGRWLMNVPPYKSEGNWVEPDCEWKRFDLIEDIEKKIFKDSNMHLKFWGASNYQNIMSQYWNEQCPREKANDLLSNGLQCKLPENQDKNEITFEWQFFRGSCMQWPYAETKGCADIWTERIVNHNMNEFDDPKSEYSCNYLLGLNRQQPSHRLANITFLVNGLWTQRYSNITHINDLYKGIEYMFEQCSDRFESRMNEMGFFYKQSFATSAAPTRKFELRRFNNHQLENYIQLALKTIMKKKSYLVGVFWSFQRTFSRHLTNDPMHQDGPFYKRHNRDIFNELFRYIPSNMHQKCIRQFDQDCLHSILH